MALNTCRSRPAFAWSSNGWERGGRVLLFDSFPLCGQLTCLTTTKINRSERGRERESGKAKHVTIGESRSGGCCVVYSKIGRCMLDVEFCMCAWDRAFPVNRATQENMQINEKLTTTKPTRRFFCSTAFRMENCTQCARPLCLHQIAHTTPLLSLSLSLFLRFGT